MPEKETVTVYKEQDFKDLNFYYGVSSDCLTSFKRDEQFTILNEIKDLGLDYAIISHEKITLLIKKILLYQLGNIYLKLFIDLTKRMITF